MAKRFKTIREQIKLTNYGIEAITPKHPPKLNKYRNKTKRVRAMAKQTTLFDDRQNPSE